MFTLKIGKELLNIKMKMNCCGKTEEKNKIKGIKKWQNEIT